MVKMGNVMGKSKNKIRFFLLIKSGFLKGIYKLSSKVDTTKEKIVFFFIRW